MNPVRVLIVDDDPPLLRALAIHLRARHYDVDTAADGRTALDIVARRRPEAVILDLGLPDMDGVEVIRGLRGWTALPIIVLSARQESGDKVEALDAGADDYLTKPFGMDELLAGLRAAVRRAQPSSEGQAIVETEAFTIDVTACKAVHRGRDVRLTPTEWHLLEVLLRNPGRLVGQRELLREIRGITAAQDTTYLRTYMAQLRRKLEDDPSRPRHLITEPGMGYRFEP